MRKQLTYEERLTDWVLKFGIPEFISEPTKAQFSAVDVAHIIMGYTRDKLAGRLKL